MILPVLVMAQEDLYNHPELKWLSFETENFVICYTEGLEDVAALAAKIGEEIHEPLCELYGYRPDTKVTFIFSDTDDIANAGSYFQSNKIKFYATSMNWDLRGTHNWLRNVVTHEYTHMIQLGASRKWRRQILAGYIQFLGYEPERRPDVLYGYPNRLISWPLPSVTIPAWFAEGTAQYQFTGSGYDFWDSHRDMMLRQATLSGRLYSFDELSYFGKTSLGSEEVYDQGFSLTKYIADQSGGTEVLRRVSSKMSRIYPVTINDALKSITGKDGVHWHREWKQNLENKYGALKSSLEPTLTRADTIPVHGYVNLYPRLSPDGSNIAFISNQNRDYYGQSSLYLYDVDEDESKIVAGSVQGGLSWLPDGTGVLFARRSPTMPHGSIQYDLYIYLIEEKKEIRVTKGMRAEGGDVSPDGRMLVFTINEAGRRDVAIADMPNLTDDVKPFTVENIRYRYVGLPHEQHYLPRWSPDGKRIAVARHLQEGRGIRVFSITEDGNSLELERDIDGAGIELRDPSWNESGTDLLVSWDRTGIANIYQLNLEDDSRSQLTSVLGGAYYPDMRDGRLVYSDYCETGFRICRLDDVQRIRPDRGTLDDTTSYIASLPPPVPAIEIPIPNSQTYKPAFESLYWFPRVMFDYGTFKPGVYLFLTDFLEKLNFTGGFAVNDKKDWDLFGIVEYRVLYPTIFAEYYAIQRRLISEFADSTRIINEEPGFIPVYDKYRIRYRYMLNEVDFGLKIPFMGGCLKTQGVYGHYTAHNRFDDETSVSITYFKGWEGKIGFFIDKRRPGITSEINPRGGYKGFLEYTRANHKFFTDLAIGGDAVGLQEIYAPYNYDMIEGGIEKYFSLPGWDHSLELRTQLGFIGEAVDPFFYLYAGGLPGMRGYSYYSLGGERYTVATASYRFPIIRRLGWNLWPLHLNRIYGTVYCDVGDAWVGDFDSDRFKKDVGGGVRMQLHSFYSYPTAVAFDVAYGFDRFEVVEDDIRTEYGQELRYYLTVLFDFYSPFSGRLFGKR